MIKFFAWANKYRKWINVCLNTFDDLQENYEKEFGKKLEENA